MGFLDRIFGKKSNEPISNVTEQKKPNIGKNHQSLKEAETPPLNSEAYLAEGLAKLASYNYLDALNALDRAIEINPGFGEAWYNKGKALDGLGGKGDEAIECYKKAIEPTFRT